MQQPKILEDMQAIIDQSAERFRQGDYTVARTPEEIRAHMRALVEERQPVPARRRG